MRLSWMVGAAAVLAVVVMPATGLAQIPSDAGRASKIMRVGDREQRMERIRSVFLRRLGEEMQLDEVTYGKMVRSFDRFQDQRRRLRQGREALASKLRAAVERGAPDAELEAIRGEYDGFRTRHNRLVASHLSEVRQILGARRYAQYLLFRQNFGREVRERLHERRRN